MDLLLGLIVGWTGGSFGMWYYFHRVGLLMTRQEYYAIKALRERYNGVD